MASFQSRLMGAFTSNETVSSLLLHVPTIPPVQPMLVTKHNNTHFFFLFFSHESLPGLGRQEVEGRRGK